MKKELNKKQNQMDFTNTHTRAHTKTPKLPFFFSWADKITVGPLELKHTTQLDNKVF